MDKKSNKKSPNIKEVDEKVNDCKSALLECINYLEEKHDTVIVDVAIIGLALDRLDQIYKDNELIYLLELVDNIRYRCSMIGIDMMIVQNNPQEGI